MQGKTDYLPKNFCIRAYQLNSYCMICPQKFLHANAQGNTIILALYNAFEEVNRFINWIFKVYCLFLISSTKEHEHLAFTSAKATNSKIFGCIGFRWLQSTAGARTSIF